jgi:hypothetical protein
MWAWAIPKPVPSKPTFMAPSKASQQPGGPVASSIAQAPDRTNDARSTSTTDYRSRRPSRRIGTMPRP